MNNALRLRRLANEAAPHIDWHWKSTALGVHVEGTNGDETYKLGVLPAMGELVFTGADWQTFSYGPWDDEPVRKFIARSVWRAEHRSPA